MRRTRGEAMEGCKGSSEPRESREGVSVHGPMKARVYDACGQSSGLMFALEKAPGPGKKAVLLKLSRTWRCVFGEKRTRMHSRSAQMMEEDKARNSTHSIEKKQRSEQLRTRQIGVFRPNLLPPFGPILPLPHTLFPPTHHLCDIQQV